MKIHKVGNIEKGEAKVVRIVHISDTHMRHDQYQESIPDGDILIHSGDFSAFSVGRYFGNKERDRESVIREINSFFQKLQFKHKVLVAGNHELSFSDKNKDFVEEQLTEVIYLQDKSITLEGLNIYGTPWSAKRAVSYARGFAKPRQHLHRYWDKIPSQTDILVTHMPPEGILDLGTKTCAGIRNLFSSNDPCNICGDMHEMNEHWGCKELKKTIFKRLRPTLHLFGHVHEGNGVTVADGITFSNAAMKLEEKINVFDYYL
ncbi:metallophosphoesterase domain-containing protein 1-like [Mercenaria mercenaria]|uniref:metallophosphoesterase domain-containing protein 1-like n=1 Tax=Mercenaria mercenaria TaxID=6596 RepID=UPI00234FAE95|nr:metallophosphoesterase domain-containing protein 1-like [Mercenaria mercenaria]